MKPRVGVIDIGSNSIKALVAEPAGRPGELHTVYENILEVRISAGISSERPALAPDRIEAGVRAVEQLWRECRLQDANSGIRIVATSAVRSASNGVLFTHAIEEATGCPAEILSGDEEALGIARGVLTDGTIPLEMDRFTVFDLGGGSLELIRFESSEVRQRTSLPLGSVRLTERFIANPRQPVPPREAEALTAYLHNSVAESQFPLAAPLIGCSGGLAALRHSLPELAGPEGSVNPALLISRSTIDSLAAAILSADASERVNRLGIPPARADIFPVAMLTFQVIMDLAGAAEIIHSFHNLRYGIASALLHGPNP